jgi:hypothetical protein
MSRLDPVLRLLGDRLQRGESPSGFDLPAIPADGGRFVRGLVIGLLAGAAVAGTAALARGRSPGIDAVEPEAKTAPPSEPSRPEPVADRDTP